MKHILLLSGYLLLSVIWRCAQVRFLASLNRTAINHISEDHTKDEASPSSQANALLAAPDAIIIPAGTHLLMKLTSPLHTTSATRGAGIYLETTFPVIVSDHVVIPEHTRVLGVVESERRPGRMQGRARMRLRFAQLILPNNHVLSI